MRAQRDSQQHHDAGDRRQPDTVAQQQGDRAPGEQERHRQFAQGHGETGQHQPRPPAAPRRQCQRERQHQSRQRFVAEEDLVEKGDHAESPGQQRRAIAFRARRPSLQRCHPGDDIGRPQQCGDEPPARRPQQGGGPCEHRRSHRDEGIERIFGGAVLFGGDGIIVFAGRNARIDQRVEIHVGALAHAGPLGDIGGVQARPRLEREAAPQAGQCGGKQDQRRGPARQAAEGTRGKPHPPVLPLTAPPRAAAISERSAMGRKARPMNIAGATIAPQ